MWSSEQQEIVSLPTAESKYAAVMHATKEALWLHGLFSEVFPDFKDATTLLPDNLAARSGGVIEQGSLRLAYCPTDDIVVDMLTNSLPSAKSLLRGTLARAHGVAASPSPACGRGFRSRKAQARACEPSVPPHAREGRALKETLPIVLATHCR